MYKVTVENTETGDKCELEYSNCEIEQRRGLNRYFNVGSGIPDVVFNGSAVCLIKLSKGCENFASHDPGNAGA